MFSSLKNEIQIFPMPTKVGRKLQFLQFVSALFIFCLLYSHSKRDGSSYPVCLATKFAQRIELFTIISDNA